MSDSIDLSSVLSYLSWTALVVVSYLVIHQQRHSLIPGSRTGPGSIRNLWLNRTYSERRVYSYPSMMGLVSILLHASSTLFPASASESASISRVICFPIRTLDTSLNPRFFILLVTAFPCGSSRAFKGIMLISAMYFIF